MRASVRQAPQCVAKLAVAGSQATQSLGHGRAEESMTLESLIIGFHETIVRIVALRGCRQI